MSETAPFLAALETAAETSSTAEAAYRREAAARTKLLAQERAFAFRRLNLMRSITRAVAGAESEEAAVASAVAALRARLGWPAESEAHAAILSRFTPVAAAVFASLCCESGEPGPDVTATLATFETWYAQVYPTPFWDLFEQPMAETPVVDF